MVETIDKAALTKLAAEKPQFLRNLLQSNSIILPEKSTDRKENPLLHQIVTADSYSFPVTPALTKKRQFDSFFKVLQKRKILVR